MTAYLQDADNLAAAKKMLAALDLISTGADGQAQTVGVNERAEKTGACCSVLSDGDPSSWIPLAPSLPDQGAVPAGHTVDCFVGVRGRSLPIQRQAWASLVHRNSVGCMHS